MGFGSGRSLSRGPGLDAQGFMGHGSNHGPGSAFGGTGRLGPRFFRGNRLPPAPTTAPSPTPLPAAPSPSSSPAATSTSAVAPESEPTLASAAEPSLGFNGIGPQESFGEFGHRGTRLGPGFSRGPEQSSTFFGAKPAGGPRFFRGDNFSPAQTEFAPRPKPEDFRDFNHGVGFGFRGSGFSEGSHATGSPQGGGRLGPGFSRRGLLPAPSQEPFPAPATAPSPAPPPAPSPAPPAAPSPAPPQAPSPVPPAAPPPASPPAPCSAPPPAPSPVSPPARSPVSPPAPSPASPPSPSPAPPPAPSPAPPPEPSAPVPVPPPAHSAPVPDNAPVEDPVPSDAKTAEDALGGLP